MVVIFVVERDNGRFQYFSGVVSSLFQLVDIFQVRSFIQVNAGKERFCRCCRCAITLCRSIVGLRQVGYCLGEVFQYLRIDGSDGFTSLYVFGFVTVIRSKAQNQSQTVFLTDQCSVAVDAKQCKVFVGP